MKSRLLKVLAGLAVLLVVVSIVIATRPSGLRVARSIVVNAAPAAVFPHVNELRKWDVWNPWGKVDPDMKLTCSGPASGVGAIHEWTGNDEVGEGRTTITESRPTNGFNSSWSSSSPWPASALLNSASNRRAFTPQSPGR